jgi:hypothetical protein
MGPIRQLLGNYRYAAIALVTVLTLGIVGAVVLTTTSVGCGPANKLGLKTAHCVSAGPVANLGPASPPAGKGLGSSPSPLPQPPTNPGTSAVPPTNPDTSATPPYNPGVSANPPTAGPLSAGAPPLAYPTSSSVPPGGPFSCRLPVYAGGPGSGGFIVFPGQTFVADPRSAVTAPSPSPGGPSPTPPPQYGQGPPPGWYGLTYDAGYSRWVPVPYSWVSPDGIHYAYPLGGEIYVQNVANGTQLELAEGQGYQPLDVENDGVYVTLPNHPGLWFLPLSGASRQVTSSGFWQAIGGGAAYGTVTSSVPQGATNTINKLDLRTGSIAPFWTAESGPSQVIGFDQHGYPLVTVSYPTGQAMFIVGPQNYYAIAAMGYGQYNPPPYPYGSPIADSHGLWFAVGGGIELYSNGAWYWMSLIGGQLAGQCL